MPVYIIDENLPAGLPFWTDERFIHVSTIEGIQSDTEIWHYALRHNLIIITKDTDFYHRYLASVNCPKVVWLKTGNLRKKDLNAFVEQCWINIESLLLLSSFIIVDQEKMEGF